MQKGMTEMKTWKDYKEHVKNVDHNGKEEIENIETMSSIISSIIAYRNRAGFSQRDLAEICRIPQSTLARIESFKTIPNLYTLLKIMQPLGITLTVSDITSYRN